MTKDVSKILLSLAASAMLAVVTLLPVETASADHIPTSRDRTPHFAIVIGAQRWSDAGDIQPDLGGEFDSEGVNLEVSWHAPIRSLYSQRLFWGFTTGLMGHDSNVIGVVEFEDLQLGAIYLTPSVKYMLHDSPSQRIFLDLGAGYYAAAIDEYEDYCYYYCDVFEYYDDSSFGGFVGIAADFDVGQPGGAYLQLGAKVHSADFRAPTDIGSNTALDGPIYQFQFGVGWGAE